MVQKIKVKKAIQSIQPHFSKPLSGLDVNVSDEPPLKFNKIKFRFRDDQRSKILKYLPINHNQW